VDCKYLYLLEGIITGFQRLIFMNAADKVIKSAFESDEVFQKTFSTVIKEDLNLTAVDFAKKANIPPSTLYKILSGNRDPNIKTLRQIVKTIREIKESDGGEFIAVIAARSVLDNIVVTKKKIGGKLVTIREYSATSMEEAIIAAVNAERDGAKALVCAPIVSPTVEKILNIPVTTIIPKNSLIEAIELALRKME
jgi:predicted transcriptional regulator